MCRGTHQGVRVQQDKDHLKYIADGARIQQGLHAIFAQDTDLGVRFGYLENIYFWVIGGPSIGMGFMSKLTQVDNLDQTIGTQTDPFLKTHLPITLKT